MALITDIGVLGNGILQPKLQNRWRMTFVGLGNSGTDTSGLTVQCKKVNRPKLKFDKTTLDRYNSRAYIAGKYSFDPITLTFEDDTGGLVTQALQDQNEIQQQIIGVNPAPMLPASPAGQLYKFAARMEMLDGNDTIFEAWSLEGAWLEDIDWGPLDYASSSTVDITVTMSIDLARQLVSGVEYNANGTFGALPA